MATVSDRVLPIVEVERIGRFEILGRARSDAFSIAYRGRDPFAGRRVQVEVCVARDEAVRRQFLSAAERASQLHHPNIATVYEFGSGDSKPYQVREAFSESTLGDFLAQEDPIEDVLKLYYLGQMARGLEYAHDKGVLHRQLQLSSILVRPDGRVKVADFGTARLASAATRFDDGSRSKPAVDWLPPELMLGIELDERSDIYGFGAVAYELLTGSPPFAGATVGELVEQVLESDPEPVTRSWPECPQEISSLVAKCLQRDPRRRYPRFSDLIEELSTTIPVPEPEEVEQELETLVTADLQTVYVTERDHEQSRIEVVGDSLSERRRSPWLCRWRSVGSRLGALRDRGTLLAAALRSSLVRAGSNVRWRRGPLWALASAMILIAVVAWGLRREPKADDSSLPSLVEPTVAEVVSTPLGSLVIDARPWARVTRVVDEQGDSLPLPQDAYTPLRLDLAPGQYLATLERPDSPVQQCGGEVVSGSTRPCRPAVDSQIDTDVYFRETGWWQ